MACVITSCVLSISDKTVIINVHQQSRKLFNTFVVTEAIRGQDINSGARTRFDLLVPRIREQWLASSQLCSCWYWQLALLHVSRQYRACTRLTPAVCMHAWQLTRSCSPPAGPTQEKPVPTEPSSKRHLTSCNLFSTFTSHIYI